MYKLLLIFFYVTVFNTSSFAQPSQTTARPNYEYFIRLSGINKRQDVEFLQSTVSNKTGVISFMANRYPVRYFVLKSDRLISAGDFEKFLLNTSFQLEFYGEGIKGKEEAILIYNKTRALQ